MQKALDAVGWLGGDGYQVIINEEARRSQAMPENPDAEKAALAEAGEALARSQDWILTGFPCPSDFKKADEAIKAWIKVVADISPAAKEILEKAQAHDEMGRENKHLKAEVSISHRERGEYADLWRKVTAENERLREAWRRKFDDRGLLDAPCLFCGYNGRLYWQAGTHSVSCPWREIGGAENRDVRAALAGKEPE